jgi:hypothetical protein
MEIKILPLAFDSLGTRSMATYAETRDAKILIDPGVALGPRRYGLPPHPMEYQRLEEHWGVIKEYLSIAEVVMITHYHYDHHMPESAELFRDKIVLVKHPEENINKSQRQRAAYFLGKLKGIVEELIYCDGTEQSFGGTTVKFSEPVCHGSNNRLGYVVEVSVARGNSSFLFTSDVEGPSLEEQVTFIMDEDPNIILADGPMTYMLGYRYSNRSLELSLENLGRVMEGTRVEKLIIDHHLLRDLYWRKWMKPLYDKAVDVDISTAAEYLGKENQPLEARRKELHQRG